MSKLAKPPKGTMTIEKAYKAAIEKHQFDFGDGYFAMVGWKNPDTLKVDGPIFVTITCNTAIEVDRFGRYVESYPKNADCYFPWIDCPTNSYSDRVKREHGK